MRSVISFLFLLTFLPLCTAVAKPVQPDSLLREEARTAIDAGNKQWIASYENGDVTGIVSLFAPDGCMLGSKGRVSRGPEAISERVSANMQYFGRHVKVTVKTLKLWIVDTTAYETGEYSYTSLQEGQETVDSGYYTTIWKKQKDGAWKIITDMSVN